MSASTITNTIFTPEDIQPLTRGTDGRMQTVYGTQPVPQGLNTMAAPVWPVSSSPSWMDQETLIPGLRNLTVLFGAGAGALLLWLMSRRAKAQVMA